MLNGQILSESLSVLLVTEAYNLAEGQSQAAFLRAVAEIDSIAARHANVAVAVVDPTVDGVAKRLLMSRYPQIEVWHLPTESYDGQKNIIAHSSKRDIIVFLDGDCRPLRDDWLDRILAPFADPTVSAVGGLTLYEDFSLTGVAMTILDFGFLYGKSGQALGCYASNNVAFRRETLMSIPIPFDHQMRCKCYKHAQLLQRADMAIRFASDAVVLHELPDVNKERHRRGYDYVAALWVDPQLAETSWLAKPLTICERLLTQNLNYALERLRRAPSELWQTTSDVEAVVGEISRLMNIDKAGIEAALAFGEANGLNSKALNEHKLLTKGTPTSALLRSIHWFSGRFRGKRFTQSSSPENI
jgi:hypothetical protein